MVTVAKVVVMLDTTVSVSVWVTGIAVVVVKTVEVEVLKDN